MGYYPVVGSPYDEDYWDKYVMYSQSEMGNDITYQRVGLVQRFIGHSAMLVDVGIGCGHFIHCRNTSTSKARSATRGWDVNPKAIDWLQERKLLHNPYEKSVPNICFWDVIEHIPDAADILKNVMEYVFVTVPIFRDAEHILQSKHFRPDEHCWYWTREGFIDWMSEQGFKCVEHNTNESLLGREDSHTFVFLRMN